jgi:hypothetical protein
VCCAIKPDDEVRPTNPAMPSTCPVFGAGAITSVPVEPEIVNGVYDGVVVDDGIIDIVPLDEMFVEIAAEIVPDTVAFDEAALVEEVVEIAP